VPDQLQRLKAALEDRYAIQEELGSGGMATVYLAEDLKHHRRVAVKVLRPDLAATLGPERFLREIEVAARLHHPHILPLYDSGHADGFLYYVMPYEEGQSLRERLAHEGELPVPEAVRLLRDVVDALTHAHGQGVVHRDIKPDNVMLSGRHALVTDFGVAKAVSEATGRAKLTTAGVALGTPTYMAPEQAAGDDHIDHRADIYAVGVLGYELLAGRPPFTGTTAQEVLAAHVTQAPNDVTAHRASVPPALAHLVMRCLEKKAADRWQSAEELLPQLEALATPSGGLEPTSATIADSATRPTLSIPARPALVAAAVVIVGLAGWFLLGRGEGTTGAPSESEPGGAVAAAPLRDDRPSVAVLPFVNRSGRDEDRYFTDGIHDEILTRLAKISALKTISRTSVEEYRETPKNMRVIGEELNVRYLLEGGVQRSGDRVRVNVQLIDAEDEGHLWGEIYDTVLTVESLFDIQSDIALAVAGELRAAISDEERRRIARNSTDNMQAYDYLLRGLQARRDYTRGSRETFAEAEQLFNEAIRYDGGFSLAHIALGQVHAITYQYGYDRSDGRRQLARASFDRATELDPELPETHYGWGVYYYRIEKDFPRALEALRRAEGGLRGSEGLARLRGYVERRTGRWEDAIRSLERAHSLDPRSTTALVEIATSYRYLRRYDEAIRAWDRVLELNPRHLNAGFEKADALLLRDGDTGPLREYLRRQPDPSYAVTTRWRLGFYARNWPAALSALERGGQALVGESQYWTLPRSLVEGWTHAAAGEGAAARQAFQSAVTVLEDLIGEDDGDDRYHRALGLAYAGLGRRGDAVREGERALALLPPEADALNGSYNVLGLGMIHAQLGDAENAVVWLERALSEPGRGSVHTINLDPLFDPIREHPLFRELVEGR
jgi:serine/threonine-protein kinase